MGIGGGPADRMLPPDIIPNHITPIVLRTSQYGFDPDRPPCPGAYLSRVEVVDRVPAKFVDEVWDPARRARWYQEGHGHTQEETGGEVWYARRMGERPCWRIKIATLADLLALQAQHGEIVLCRHDDNTSELALEIYDSWRE